MWADAYHFTTVESRIDFYTVHLHLHQSLNSYIICVKPRKRRNHPLRSIVHRNCDPCEYNPQETLMRHHLRQQELNKEQSHLGKEVL